MPAIEPNGRKPWGWIAAVAGIVLVGAIVAIVLVNGGEKKMYTLRGTSLLMDELGDVTGSWDDCQGSGGYDDFGPGQNVSVVDGQGNLIGSGNTQSVTNALLPVIVQMDRDAGAIGLEATTDDAAEDEARDLLQEMADLGVACLLYFEIEVPESDFYTVEVGSRGELDYSLDEMKSNNFVVALTLGS